MRAGLYARVSTTEQAEEGYSIEAQLEAMRRYCREHDGWTVVAAYKDEGFSGTSGDRPDLQKALAACEAGRVDVLVTHKLDRLFRNLREMLNAVDELEGWGVSYVSVVENIDRSTPHGKLLFNQLGSVAQYFSDNLGTEIRKGKRGRAKAGLSNAAYPPYGYRRVEGQAVFEVDSDEAETVLSIFMGYASGAVSFAQIAATLNNELRPAHPLAKRGRWTSWAVSTILKNRFYIREVIHTDKATGEVTFYDGQHKPIIDRDLFERVELICRGRANKQTRQTKHDYLLQALVFCCHCGSVMHSTTKLGKYRYYTDPADRKGIDCPVAGQRVSMSEIDGQVEALIKRLRLPDDWKTRIVELANHRHDRDKTERHRQRVQAKLGRLKFLFLEEGDLTESDYRRRKAELQAQLDALRVPERSSVIEAGEYLDTLGELWDKGTVKQRHRLLQGMVHKVRVDLLDRRVVCVEPHPEFVALFRGIEGLEERQDGCFWWEEEETSTAC